MRVFKHLKHYKTIKIINFHRNNNHINKTIIIIVVSYQIYWMRMIHMIRFRFIQRKLLISFMRIDHYK